MTRQLFKGSIIALTLLFVASSQASADMGEFKKMFASKNSWERAAAIRLLDASDKKAYKVLTGLLKREDWYIRDAIVDVLMGGLNSDNAKAMEKELKKGKGIVAEGIALAVGRSGDTSKADWIINALQAKDWRVRRSAALALKEMPDKRAIEPLLEAWRAELKKGKKAEFRVWVRCVEALEDITGEKFDTIEDWDNWWVGAKDQFAVGGKKKKKRSTTTVVRGVEIETEVSGKGGPLLAIPDYGFESFYLKTYLKNLEKFNRIIYLELPGSANFKPRLPNEPGLPYPKYPLAKITEALEELVKGLREAGTIDKKAKLNLFCHGMSTWLGMTYASKFPKSIRRLVLCSPYSSGKAWGDGNNRLIAKGQKTGDDELVHFGKSRQLQGGKPLYSASSEEESIALSRKSFTVYFFDYRDTEIGYILGPRIMKKIDDQPVGRMFRVFRPMGGVIIPSDFKLAALPKVPTTTMVMVGKNATMTSIQDAQAVVKHYPRGSMKVFGKSSRMPFVEENTLFVKTMNKFLN